MYNIYIYCVYIISNDKNTSPMFWLAPSSTTRISCGILQQMGQQRGHWPFQTASDGVVPSKRCRSHDVHDRFFEKMQGGSPIGSMVLLYMVTFTINIPQSC